MLAAGVLLAGSLWGAAHLAQDLRQVGCTVRVAGDDGQLEVGGIPHQVSCRQRLHFALDGLTQIARLRGRVGGGVYVSGGGDLRAQTQQASKHKPGVVVV